LLRLSVIPKRRARRQLTSVLAPTAIWSSRLRLSRFTRVIRCVGLLVRAATAQRQAPRGSQTASGILEFVTRERPSLAHSIVPERFPTTALRTVDAAPW